MCTLISVLCEYGVLEGQQNTIQTCVLSYLYCASTVLECTLIEGQGAEYNTNMCTLISVLCKYSVLEGQQNTIQTFVLYSHICTTNMCVSMVYQRGNRIQYKHVYSHICTVQVQCTRGAIEYNTNMCTLISVLCEYGVLEGQQNTIQTCVLSYLYCASTVYQRGNRIQYKHVYSHICTVQVQCTRGAIEYNTNMCTLISVLCKYGVLEGQQNTIQTCVLSYLYCVSTVYQRGNRIQYKHVYSHICTVQVQCTRGAIEYNTNMCTLVSVLCKYSVLEGQQNTIQTCVLSYLYCASTVYQRGNRIQYKHVYSRMYQVCTRGAIEYNTNMCTLSDLYCVYSVLEGQQNTIQTCVLSYLYCVSTVYQRGNRIQYKHVYSHICTVQVQCTRGAIEYNTNMCTLISVLCKYGVLEGQQNTIQTCVLSYLYCVSMVYQRGNRIQYKHVYSHICIVQLRCTRGAIEYNTNMCTLLSVLCKYGVLEGNRVQYKHVYSHICTM